MSALQQNGVKAVLPSHRKPRKNESRSESSQDVRLRWIEGDWIDRVDSSGLAHAKKFLEDPARPPTGLMPAASRPRIEARTPSQLAPRRLRLDLAAAERWLRKAGAWLVGQARQLLGRNPPKRG